MASGSEALTATIRKMWGAFETVGALLLPDDVQGKDMRISRT
jgi:hypothetical protein